MCLQRVIVTDKSCTRVTILGTLKSHCLFPYELWNNTVDVTYHNSSKKQPTLSKRKRDVGVQELHWLSSLIKRQHNFA